MAFKIVNEPIKEGDYVVNTESKKSLPKLVSKNEFGYLGFNQKGWFSWMPLGLRHKKVIINTTGESL